MSPVRANSSAAFYHYAKPIVLVCITLAGLLLSQVNIPLQLVSDPYPECSDPNPRLPNVLLIGDSTQIRYFPFVVTALKGEANVCRLVELAPQRLHSLFHGGPLVQPVNARSTEYARHHLDEWLGEIRWDVIHFNWGLHDLSMWKTDESRGNPDAAIDAYRSNLEILLNRMELTHAQLVVATTTPLPESQRRGAVAAAVEAQNRVAAEVAVENGHRVNDLYSVAWPRLELIQEANDVHFNAEGNRVLGESVASSILDSIRMIRERVY